MLVLKSILRGEFAAPPLASRKYATKDISGSSLVSEVTTIESTTRESHCSEDDEQDFSVGSALPGDSFVLDVDWTESAETVTYYHPVVTASEPGFHHHNTDMNGSMEDPYLLPMESVRRRLCRGEGGAPGEEKENATITDKQETLKTASSVPSSSNSGQVLDYQKVWERTDQQPVKSLGTFQFPVSNNASFPSQDDELTTDGEYETDEEEDPQRPSKAINVPPLPNFNSLSMSSPVLQLDESFSNSSLNESATLPTTPLVCSGSNGLTRRIRNRELRYKARVRASELRDILERKQQEPKQQRPVQTAQLYLQLGLAQQQAHDFPAAISSFFQAAALYRHFGKPAALATVLDHAAASYMQAVELGSTATIHQYHKAARFHQCLEEALDLRKQELGPWHVDTVSTLQNLAKLLLLTGHPARAAVHYVEVVHLRRAIFGPNHPSTAVTAHCLGNAYLQSHDTVAAEIWYHHALQIYNAMRLPNDNPAVARLLRDRQQLERVERWMQEGVTEDENLLFEL